MLQREYYYNRYRQIRKNIFDTVNIGNYQTAKTNLQNTLSELNEKYPNSEIRNDYNHSEKLLIQHAINHINSTINNNDPEYLDENGQIKHQSDVVKSALIKSPEQNP